MARTPAQIIGHDALTQLIFEGYAVVPAQPTEAMIAAAETALDDWRKSLPRDEFMVRSYVPPPRKSHKFIASATPAEKHTIRYRAMIAAAQGQG